MGGVYKLTSPFTDTTEHRNPGMSLCNVVDQFHDEHGSAFATTLVRCSTINHFDARFEDCSRSV